MRKKRHQGLTSGKLLLKSLMRTGIIISLAIILTSFIIGGFLYPRMPERMASHWNLRDEVDGYISRFWGLFLMPLISIGILLLFLIIPLIDPLKENIVKFRRYFDLFIVFIILFLFYLYILTLLWNSGLRFRMSRFFIPALTLLFFYCGILIEKAKRNWFVGIRTPWTLTSEAVWEKTHKLGGRLWKIGSPFFLLGIIFGENAFQFVILFIILLAFYPVVYSYFAYQKERRNERGIRQG